MVEGWIKNLPKNKNFVRRIYVEMPARHLNVILGHAIISKSQQVLIEAILPFPKICITEIGAIFWCLYWHYPWLCSCYCQSRYFYNTFVSLQCHQKKFSKKPNNYWDANAFNIWKVFTRKSNWCMFIWDLFPQRIPVFCLNDKNIFQGNIRKEITSKIKNISKCPKVFGYFLLTVLNMVYFLCNLITQSEIMVWYFRQNIHHCREKCCDKRQIFYEFQVKKALSNVSVVMEINSTW